MHSITAAKTFNGPKFDAEYRTTIGVGHVHYLGFLTHDGRNFEPHGRAGSGELRFYKSATPDALDDYTAQEKSTLAALVAAHDASATPEQAQADLTILRKVIRLLLRERSGVVVTSSVVTPPGR